MSDYGIHQDLTKIESGSMFFFPSGALGASITAISASTPQILAVTCSSNLNNRLTPPNATSSYSIISFSTGSNQQRLILRYFSGSIDSEGNTTSATPDKYIFKTTGSRDRYIDVPILNNDDSLAVAFKTVNSLTKTKGFNTFFSASLNSICTDEIGSTGVGSITIEDDFIVGHYPGSTGLSNTSQSLGENMTVGTSFKIRAGGGIGDIVIEDGFTVGDYTVPGRFLIYSINSLTLTVT